MDIVNEAQWVFNTEIAALHATKDSLGRDFETIVQLILHCQGKVVISGMGKPGHIGTKIAATLASLGTPSFRVKPCTAIWAWCPKKMWSSSQVTAVKAMKLCGCCQHFMKSAA